jgi:hypothetical protein
LFFSGGAQWELAIEGSQAAAKYAGPYLCAPVPTLESGTGYNPARPAYDEMPLHNH